MTQTSTGAVPTVGTAFIRGHIDRLAERHHAPGAVALRAVLAAGASPRATSSEGVPISIDRSVSALHMRQQLAARADGEWLVLLTDRDENDLGAGILAHIVGGRVRSVDVWDSVRDQFHATELAPNLTRLAEAREVALGILGATPKAGRWPAAPGGVLTREHALDAVLEVEFDVPTSVLDLQALLAWTFTGDRAAQLERAAVGLTPALYAACLDRLAERVGAAADAVRPLLTPESVGRIGAYGLVVDVITAEALTGDRAQDSRVALAYASTWWPSGQPPLPVLRAFGRTTREAVPRLLQGTPPERDGALRLLDRADALLSTVQATSLADLSDLLGSSYVTRSEALGRALALMHPGGGLGEIEAAWAALEQHQAARPEHPLHVRIAAQHTALRAAVRLARWLTTPPSSGHDDVGAHFAALSRAHLDEGGWVDAAVNEASEGVDSPVVSSGIENVVHHAFTRREEEAARFATALTAVTRHGGDRFGDPESRVFGIERVLEDVVRPVVERSPLLFILLDGMSAASAVSIVSDAVARRGWQEVRAPGAASAVRAAAIAALPTLTRISRTTLFAGRLADGDQADERVSFTTYGTRRAKVPTQIFHKKSVEQTRRGWSVSADVGAAIDDVQGTPLVGVVLNTIDDALDRSDPGGAVWTAESIKHLEPLLQRASAAGRTVVITGDHGHIIERREGHTLPAPSGSSSNRSRSVGGPIAPGEVLIEGPRVVSDDHQVVLAVSEHARYGPIKAGYHGGAHPAEVVVPVIVLKPSAVTVEVDEAMPPQDPRWWNRPLESSPATSANPPAPKRKTTKAAPSGPALFDVEPVSTVPTPESLGARIVASPRYADQAELVPRLSLSTQQVTALVDDLVSAGGRLTATPVAQALGVPLNRLRGAREQAKQVLNVEGYPVLSVDPDGSTLVLDIDLLCDQFEVHRPR